MARKASNNNFQIDKTPCAQVIDGAMDHANCLGQAGDKAQSTTKDDDVPALQQATEAESVQGEVIEPEAVVQGTSQETSQETNQETKEEEMATREVQAETREEQTLVAAVQNESTPLPTLATKSQKSEAGISITVPMKYYRQISFLKIRTGIPIRDLALRAVIEFLERNKLED